MKVDGAKGPANSFFTKKAYAAQEAEEGMGINDVEISRETVSSFTVSKCSLSKRKHCQHKRKEEVEHEAQK